MIVRPAKGVWFVPSQHRYTEGHEQEVYPGKLAGQSPKAVETGSQESLLTRGLCSRKDRARKGVRGADKCYQDKI